MSLSPDARVLLTESLQPPPGFKIDIAVGATYSLDLTALLLAPMSFALYEHGDSSDLGSVDPIRLLDAVRRYAQSTTVFCQAGAIAVPARYRSILTFVEGSVAEVNQDGALFHPKVWALRFIREETVRHRLVVLSRNMTFDQSWDTVLVLEESEDGTIDAAPAGAFLRSLPSLCVRPLEADRAVQVEELATSMASVRFAAPEGFHSGELLPLGGPMGFPWPFPERAERVLAISPFISPGPLRGLAGLTDERTLISRAETLEELPLGDLQGWRPHVLHALAEPEGEEEGGATSSTPELPTEDMDFADPRSGLHAKTFICDLPGGTSQVVTGSANLTGAAWSRNIEFGAVLEGRTDRVGVDAALNGLGKEVPGLVNLLEPYVPDPDAPETSGGVDTWAIEEFHHGLASSNPVLQITIIDDQTVTADLTLPLPEDPHGFSPETTIWPLALPEATGALTISEHLSWEHALENISPFLAVQTTWGSGKEKVTRRCVIMAELVGDPGDRAQNAVLSVLRNRADVLRYLVFLLGDPTYDALLGALEGEGSWESSDHFGHNTSIALFEPLVRAIGQDTAELAQIHQLVRDLRQIDEARDPGAEPLMPEGLEELWDAVRQAHRAEVAHE